MAQLETDLTRGSVARQLVQYAVPLVVSSLLQSIYSITDIMVAGKFVGDAAVSAINTSSIVLNMITQIAIGLTIGGTILIGQTFGRGETEPRRQAAGTLFLLCLLAGVVASVGFRLCTRPLMVLLNAPALAETADYFSICSIGIFFLFSYNALSAILRGVGNSRVPLYCILVSVTLNVALDFLFMAVLDWGVRGAAVATVTGQAISFLTALAFSFRHRADLGLTAAYVRLPGAVVRAILKLGLPTALQFTIASISWLTVVTLINQYGVEVSAGNGVANKIRDFCQLFLTSVTSAAGTMCAQCIGASLFDRAEQVMKTCLRLALAMAVCIILLTECFAPQLCGLFSLTPEAQHWAVLNLRIEIVCQIFYAAMFAYNTLATGSGRTLFVMWNSFLNCIVVRLVLALVLDHFFGVVGVYIACGIAVSSSVPVSYWFYRSRRWTRPATA